MFGGGVDADQGAGRSGRSPSMTERRRRLELRLDVDGRSALGRPAAGRSTRRGRLGQPSSRSRPSARRRRSPSWTSRTSAASLSGPRQSRSAPAISASTAALGDPAARRRAGHVERVADDHAVEAEVVTQQAEHRRGSGSPGRSGRARAARCARSSPTPRRPRPPPRTAPARARPARHRVGVDRRQRRGGSPARCRRGPGSAWRRPRRPADCRPVDPGRDVPRDEAGSAPKLRTPITGLSGLLLTSATGPRSRSMPAPRARRRSRAPAPG